MTEGRGPWWKSSMWGDVRHSQLKWRGAGSLGPQSANDLPLSLCFPSLHFPSLCSLSSPLCLWGGGQRGYFYKKSSTTTTFPTSPLVTGGENVAVG